MKNTNKSILKIAGFIAIATIFGFGFIACGDGGDNTTPYTPPAETTFSVKGEFDDKKFSLANAESYARSARNVTAESYAIKGELEDGDFIFRLTGTYDPVARNYTASAASSMIRFSISGAFNEAGVSLGSTATVLTKDSGGEWTGVTHVVEESQAVSFTATQFEPEAAGGIPSWAYGWWTYSETGMEVKGLLSQWDLLMETTNTNSDGTREFISSNGSVIEAENKGSYWDVILGFPVYIGTQAQVEAAAAAFLTSKNLTGTKLNGNPYYTNTVPGYEDLDYSVTSASEFSAAPEELFNAISKFIVEETNKNLKTAADTHFSSLGYTKLTDEQATFLKNSGLQLIDFSMGANPTGWYYVGNLTDSPVLQNGVPIDVCNGGTLSAVPGNVAEIGGITISTLTNPFMAILDSSIQDTFNTRRNGGDFDPSKAEIEAFITEFLLSKGITPQPPIPTGILYWYNEETNNVQWGVNIQNNAQKNTALQAIDLYHITNYLERYLINDGVEPQTVFSKNKVTFSNNNTQMKIETYLDKSVYPDPSRFDTLAKAKAATETQELATLTR